MVKQLLIGVTAILFGGCAETFVVEGEPALDTTPRQWVRLGDETWSHWIPVPVRVDFPEGIAPTASFWVGVEGVFEVHVSGPPDMLARTFTVPVVELPGTPGAAQAHWSWYGSPDPGYIGQLEVTITDDRIEGRIVEHDFWFASELSLGCLVPCADVPELPTEPTYWDDGKTGGVEPGYPPVPGTSCFDTDFVTPHCAPVAAALR